jgi:hypothetical protein
MPYRLSREEYDRNAELFWQVVDGDTPITKRMRPLGVVPAQLKWQLSTAKTLL